MPAQQFDRKSCVAILRLLQRGLRAVKVDFGDLVKKPAGRCLFDLLAFSSFRPSEALPNNPSLTQKLSALTILHNEHVTAVLEAASALEPPRRDLGKAGVNSILHLSAQRILDIVGKSTTPQEVAHALRVFTA